MPPSGTFCLPEEQFVELLKHYEETNAFGLDYTKDNPIWLEIAAKAKISAVYCRKKWFALKYNYIKLKHMIEIGRVTEDSVRMHEKTCKYLDGRFDFLDRFLSIPDKALPLSVHRFFDSLFGEETVDAVKLIKLNTDGSAIQVIQDYNQGIGTEPTSILPNTEQAIEEDDVELVASTPVHQVILPTIKLHQDDPSGDMASLQYITSGSIQPIKSDPIEDMARIQYITSSSIQPTNNEEPNRKRKSDTSTCNLARFLVKYTNTNIESGQDSDLKEYMNDLAEVLCNRLAPRKRKYFLSQIDLIVSDMLEG